MRVNRTWRADQTWLAVGWRGPRWDPSAIFVGSLQDDRVAPGTRGCCAAFASGGL